MSASFHKTGVITANGNNINENLCIDSMKNFGQSSTAYNVVQYNLSESLIEGDKYTISAKVNMSEERASVAFYLSGGSYKLVGWLLRNDTGMYSGTFTATATHAASTAGDGHGYVRVYSSSNATGGNGSLAGTANVDWIKLEKGELVTPWCQNAADYGYVGLSHGFIEIGDMMKIYDEYIETAEFIEF